MNVALIHSFIESLMFERGLAVRSVAKYADDLDRFAIFIESRGKTFPDVDITDCRAWLEYRFQYDNAKTANSKVILFSKFFKFLMREGLVTASPFASVLPAKTGAQDLGVVPSVEVMERLLGVISNIRDRAMFELMYASGLRISELVNLRVQNIHVKNRIVQVTGKGRVERIVPINDFALAYVVEYMKNHRADSVTANSKDFLFLTRAGSRCGSQMSNSAFYQTMMRYMDKAGIGRVYSPHSIRHAFATHLLNGGANILAISKMLGHANVSTTTIYASYAIDHLKVFLEKHHPRGPNFVAFARKPLIS